MEGGNLAIQDPIDPIGYPIDTHTIKSWKKIQSSNREGIRGTLGGAHAWTSNDQHVWLSGFIFCVDIVILKNVRKMSTFYTLYRVFITLGCQIIKISQTLHCT